MGQKIMTIYAEEICFTEPIIEAWLDSRSMVETSTEIRAVNDGFYFMLSYTTK